MSELHCDALVFFGATGDLAYKKIFPALQAMVRRGHLKVPVIGVAKAGWALDNLKARARDSVEKHGGLDPAAFAKLSSLLRYAIEQQLSVDGDLTYPPRGTAGFGYDPMFIPDGHARTFGEMTAAEKHGLPADGSLALSHRARAFQSLARACL